MGNCQIYGGTGGGACPRCGQYENACRCLDHAQKLADAIKEEANKPPCRPDAARGLLGDTNCKKGNEHEHVDTLGRRQPHHQTRESLGPQR
jgi:hypothetical protein